jgi:Tryptophan-rich protein (DUF2389)
MLSSCDPSVRFWINAQATKDPKQWNPGWQTLEEMATEKDELVLIE